MPEQYVHLHGEHRAGRRIVGNNGSWLVLGGNGVNGDKFVHAETTTLLIFVR